MKAGAQCAVVFLVTIQSSHSNELNLRSIFLTHRYVEISETWGTMSDECPWRHIVCTFSFTGFNVSNYHSLLCDVCRSCIVVC